MVGFLLYGRGSVVPGCHGHDGLVAPKMEEKQSPNAKEATFGGSCQIGKLEKT